MIYGVRQFKLINATGAEYDMTRPEALLHAPDGLGWGTEATVNRLGMTYIGIDEREVHQTPSGEMVFRTYEEYGRFLAFCQQGGLVLCYKPLDTWYYVEALISINKSEIQWQNNHLICPVQFTLLSYWYEKVVAQTAEPPEPEEPHYATVTGDPAVFNARHTYPIKELTTDIQGSLDTNGYDGVWVGGAGKNLFNGTFSSLTVNLLLSTAFSLKAGTYTISLKCDKIMQSFALRNGSTQTSTVILEQYNTKNITVTLNQDYAEVCVTLYNNTGLTPEAITDFQIEKGSTATAYEPYENIGTITSYDTVHITQTGSETNTYAVELTGRGDVYKGTLNVTTGELVVSEAVIKLNTADMNNNENYPGWRASGIRALVGRDKNSYSGRPSSISNNYGINTVSSNDILFFFPNQINIRQTRLVGMAIDIGFIVPLATPLTYQLTPTQLNNLIGQNTISSDTGAVTVTYRTDGATPYKVYPYRYSYQYGSTAQNVFDIHCNLPSYFKLTIFGEATNPSYRVLQNGETVKSGRIRATVGTSQKLVINTDPKNVEIGLYTLSNTRINNLYGYSDFATERIFALPQGDCQLQVLTDDETQPKVMIEVLKHV